MAVQNNENEKETNRLLIKSIEDDLDYLLTEEFYDGRRTPCYAVKFLRDSIKSNPTIESCLVRGNYMTLAPRADGNDCHRLKNSGMKTPWQNNDRAFLTNSAHRYLSEKEVTTESIFSPFGRPTRATLLRERMHGNLSRLGSMTATVRRPISCAVCCGSAGDKRLSSANRRKNEHDPSVGHGFLVGARYNAAHFLDLDCIKTKGLYVSKYDNGVVFTTADPSSESELASPPNSPESPREESSPPLDVINQEVTGEKVPRQERGPCLHGMGSARVKMLPRPQSSVVSSKAASQRGLPVVIGSSWIPAGDKRSTYRHPSGSKASWSRSAINMHFSKQNRARQNRYRNGTNPSRCSPDPSVYNKGCINCSKCSQP